MSVTSRPVKGTGSEKRKRKFSGRDAEIVAKFKQGGRTKTDIGREYGISCERVRQIVWRAARAMNRLREDWE
jgi:DNA-directed RNA polymerase sigma subunit (sigma70/sigma32)